MDLPAEVWSYILGSLRPAKFWTLRSVNAFFYALVWGLLRKVHLRTDRIVAAQGCLQRGCRRASYRGAVNSDWAKLRNLWILQLSAVPEKKYFRPTEPLPARHLILRGLCIPQLPGFYRSIHFKNCPKIPFSLRGNGGHGYVHIEGEVSWLELSNFTRLTVVVENQVLGSRLSLRSCGEVYLVGQVEMKVLLRVSEVRALTLSGQVIAEGCLNVEELACYIFPVQANYSLRVRKLSCVQMLAHQWERLEHHDLEELHMSIYDLYAARSCFPHVHTITTDEPVLAEHFSAVFPQARFLVSDQSPVLTPDWAF